MKKPNQSPEPMPTAVTSAASQSQQPARTLGGHVVARLEVIHGVATHGGPYQFFEFTSLSITMSKA